MWSTLLHLLNATFITLLPGSSIPNRQMDAAYDLRQTTIEQQQQWQILEHEWTAMDARCDPRLGLGNGTNTTRLRLKLEAYKNTTDRLLTRIGKGIPDIVQSRDSSQFELHNQQVIHDSSRINSLIYEISESLENDLVTPGSRADILEQWRQSKILLAEHAWTAIPFKWHRIALDWVWQALVGARPVLDCRQTCGILAESMLRSRSCLLHFSAMEHTREILLRSFDTTLDHHRSAVELSMRVSKESSMKTDIIDPAFLGGLTTYYTRPAYPIYNVESYCQEILEILTSLPPKEVVKLCIHSV